MAAAEELQKGKSREEIDALKRKILFVPCKTKQALHKWIRLFLDLDIPDSVVDEDSNSCPMDMIWEVYSNAINNRGEDFARVMYYASRDSFKTLAAAILEVLAVCHLGRDVAHMAAIEAQSRKSQQYVKQFFSKPILRDFVTGDNLEIMWVSRYQHFQTGENIPEERYKIMPPELRDLYMEVKHYIHIVICTMAGANSEHVPFFVVDEVDVVANPRAYEEAKMIPAPRDGLDPITMMISTRKSTTGLVQKEIEDEFDKETGVRKLWVRHWNIIDVTRRCPPERHLVDEPKIPIYVDPNSLRAINEEKFSGMSPVEQAKFQKNEGYTGCLKNCRIFAACQGRLATHQKSNSSLLKKIDHTAKQLGIVSAQTAIAQLLCKKPSTENLVYPNFDRAEHVISAAKMAEKILGFPVDPETSKKDLIEIMRSRGLICYAGMDFGFTHNFAVVTFFVDGNHRAFVVDVISEPELMPDQQVKTVDARIKKWEPTIFADPESPQMIAYFRKAGYRMRDWQKLAGSVVGGINVVHMRLRPPMSSDPLIYFLAGDLGVDLLVKRLSRYHWKEDTAGRITDKPSDIDDDECDALRYGVMNVFSPTMGRTQMAADGPAEGQTPVVEGYTMQNWMRKAIEENGGYSQGSVGSTGKRGRFKWDI